MRLLLQIAVQIWNKNEVSNPKTIKTLYKIQGSGLIQRCSMSNNLSIMQTELQPGNHYSL